jgi:hypothetical protein
MENGSESTEQFTVSQDEGLATPDESTPDESTPDEPTPDEPTLDEPTPTPSHKGYKEFSEATPVEFEDSDLGWDYKSLKKARRR